MQQVFGRKESAFFKGIAIFLMAFHHCFLQGRFETFNVRYSPFHINQIYDMASFCKICVSLFVFISGYGLYLSIKRSSRPEKWVIYRIIKTLSGFWFIVLICWITFFIFGNHVTNTYFSKNIVYGIFCMGADFFGVSGFFNMPQLDSSWWYFSASIIYISIAPILQKCVDRYGGITTVILILIFPGMCNLFPGWTNFYSFLPIYTFGMIFAKYDCFVKVQNGFSNMGNVGKSIVFIIYSGILIYLYILYKELSIDQFWIISWNVIPVIYIVYIYIFLMRIKTIKKVLEFFGNYSMNIFCIHTVILYTCCQKWIMQESYFMVAYIKLLLLSLVSAILIEKFKDLLHYEKVINKIMEKI